MSLGVHGVDDVVEAVKADLRSLHDATLSRLQLGRAPSDGGPGQSIADGLLAQTQKMVEQDMQETFVSLTKNLEAKMNRMLETIGNVQNGAVEHQLDVDNKLAEIKKTLAKSDTKSAEVNSTVVKTKARVGQLDQSCRDVEAANDALSLKVTASLRNMEQALARHDETMQKMSAKLDGIAATQEEHAKQLASLKAGLETSTRDRPRIATLEQKTRDLEQYNEDFMELSKRSTQGFEGDMDNRLAALDTRYASLLKHYHSTVMQHVAGVQEGVEGKARALHATLETEVARLSEETSNISITCRNATDTLNADIKTLNRRLLNGLRLMKDMSGVGAAGGGGGEPFGAASPRNLHGGGGYTGDGLGRSAGGNTGGFGHAHMHASDSNHLSAGGPSTMPMHGAATPSSAFRASAATTHTFGFNRSNGGGVGGGDIGAAHAAFTPSAGQYPTPQPTTRSLNVSAATDGSSSTLRPPASPSNRARGAPTSVAASTAKIDEFLRGLEQLTGAM